MKYALTLLFLAIATPTSASEVCKSLGGFARAVMDGRQQGISIVEPMKVATSQMLVGIVNAAYAQPRQPTRKKQMHSIDSFRLAVEVGCYVWSAN